MSPQNAQSLVDEIFLHARLLDGESRQRLLDEACGDDDDLRRQVEQLLGADEQAERETLWKVQSTQKAPQPPSRVGHYRIVQELGKGGFGHVYLGQDEHLHRTVAIKIPRPASVSDPEQFVTEARNLAAVKHPNIVRIYDFGATGEGVYYAVYEYIEGGNIAARAQGQPLDQRLAARLVLKVAEALAHVHAKAIYHRDVKPANILLDTDDHPYLADFGLAVSEDDWNRRVGVSGTPDYMSPEQARGEAQVDGRSDIFSLGTVFYELLTGKRPFTGGSALDILARVQTKTPQPPRELNWSIDPELQRICLQALAKSVDDRYQTAYDMADDLRRFLDSHDSQEGSTGSAATVAGEAPPNLPSTKRNYLPSTEAALALGEFKLKSVIGAGGMAVVYRARQSAMKRDVALKCIRLGDPKTEARFRREIKALGAVKHPHLVAIHASGVEAGQAYYAMELIDGADLTSVCRHLTFAENDTFNEDAWKGAVMQACEEVRALERNVQPADLDAPAEDRAQTSEPALDVGTARLCESAPYIGQIAETIRQIADAAQALHDAGIIHRDIKPGNIMVTRESGQSILMDLGIAHAIDEREEGLTRTREFVGTLRYSSPEQVLAAGGLDHRTDVYSLGAALWELLAMRPMFGGRRHVHDAQIIHKIEFEEPESVRKYNRAVPVDLAAIVQKCLEKNPSRRYATARDLSDDLQRFQQGQPVAARPVGSAVRLMRTWRRRPLVPTLLASIILLCAVMGSMIFGPRLAPQSNEMRLGIKPWIGYAPLFVADEMGLCSPVDLEFVPVEDIDDTRSLVGAGDLDAAMWLIDSHVHSRARKVPAKAILKLNVSGKADAVVAGHEIESFAELAGKKVAYVYQEAPHYLFLALCEKHGIEKGEITPLARDTASEAVQLFMEGEADAVVIYGPALMRAQQKGRIIATAEDVPNAVVDILTVNEKYLAAHRDKVKSLVRGWFEAVELLEGRNAEAERIACGYLNTYFRGEDDPLYSVADYRRMASGMQYGGQDDNERFFRKNDFGVSRFHELLLAAQDRLQRHEQLGPAPPPQEGDGSDVLFE